MLALRPRIVLVITSQAQEDRFASVRVCVLT